MAGREAVPSGSRLELGVAALVFAATVTALYHPMLGEGFGERALLGSFNQLNEDGTRSLEVPGPNSLLHTDLRYMVWLTSHGADALLHRPWAYFDAAGCFPGESTLAYGETGLTLGLLGAPAWLLTASPVATYNVVVLLATWIAAMAMFLLVRAWTGSAAAGMASGFLYAFSEIRAADTVHLNIFDTAWTVLALLLATRLFQGGRWPHAVGLGLCVVLQMGSSFYSLVSAALVGVPIAVWLAAARGVRALRPAHLALIAAVIAPTAVFLFSPYLAFEASGELAHQSQQYYAALSFLLPGSPGFFGWATLALALAAFALPRPPAMADADPRLALLVGTLLVLLFSIGAVHNVGFVAIGPDSDVVTPYMLLARLVPGLDVVRSPVALMPAAHIGACALAGIGAAAVAARVPERAHTWAAVAIVVVAALETLRPAFLGLTPRIAYAPVRTAPPPGVVTLFEQARLEDNDGPVLMVPVRPRDLIKSSSDLLLTAYHGRRTSACYNFGHFPPGLAELSRRLPEPGAVDALLELGFTTVALDHPQGGVLAAGKRARLDAAAEEPGGRLRRVVGDDALTLYALVPAPGA